MKEWILEKVMHWCGYQNWIAWRWNDTFKLTKVYPTNKEKIMMGTKDTYTHFNVYKNNKWGWCFTGLAHSLYKRKDMRITKEWMWDFKKNKRVLITFVWKPCKKWKCKV